MSHESSAEHPKKALIVDDDAMVRLLASVALSRVDLDCEEAADGVEAIERFRRGGFDLMLLDVEMPIMDGITACAKIRRLPGGESMAIVMSTGLDDPRSIERAFDAGATDFITKPINWNVLTHRVRYLLRARQAFVEVQESRSRLCEAQEIAHLGHWEWDIGTGEAHWSEEALRILGRGSSSVAFGWPGYLESVHPNDRPSVTRIVSRALERGQPFQFEHLVLLPSGEERVVFSKGQLAFDGSGEPERLRCIIQDVTEQRRAEERIHLLSFYDELTGLPNRELFGARAKRLLQTAARERLGVAALVLDLDRFTRINESLGFSIGDELLKRIAERIVDQLRRRDLAAPEEDLGEATYLVARPGADEFNLMLMLPRSNGIAAFLQRLLEAIAKPIEMGDREMFVTPSIGVSVYPDDGEDVERLLMNAGSALARAKADGGKCFRFYAKEMNTRASERLSLESRLNRALPNNELQLFYQPQVSLASGQVVGMETLLRWVPPGSDPISPGVFIPLAEESGLILGIGAWVIDAACQQIARWRTQGLQTVRIAVNLSARQFYGQDLEALVSEALAAAAIEPDALELEITEGILMADSTQTRDKLMALKRFGVKLSVDDFGTGYSSLAYLKTFPVDALKIDRSFIRDLDNDSRDEAIVQTIVALCRGLGLTTVAEGVETAAQEQLLRRLGCDLVQGFVFSRPVSAERAAEFLASGRPRCPELQLGAGA